MNNYFIPATIMDKLPDDVQRSIRTMVEREQSEKLTDAEFHAAYIEARYYYRKSLTKSRVSQ